jgi:hypothetical protein
MIACKHERRRVLSVNFLTGMRNGLSDTLSCMPPRLIASP